MKFKFVQNMIDNLRGKNKRLKKDFFKNQLFKRLDKIEYKQNLIMDYFINPADARPAKGALYDLQNEMFDILKLFKKIVDKHNFSYWLDYGTLLGAVRHGGFIPWDSDVDVSIMENDLETLTNILNKELPKEYEFVDYWIGRVFRVRKKDPTSEAFIDIYPYLTYGKDDDGNDKIRTRHGGDNPKVKIYRPHRPFPSKILFPQSEIKFGGLSFKAPKDIDSYLRLKYGNYHTLPKSEHMEAGHPEIKDELIFYPNDFETDE